MMEHHIDKVEIIDWYDGMVYGFVGSGNQIFFALLLAFDADRRKKIFALKPISEDEAREIRQLIELHQLEWLGSSQFNRTLAGVTNILLTDDDVQAGRHVACWLATERQVRDIKSFGESQIENATSEQAISQWLH